jgi:hypothetical protein
MSIFGILLPDLNSDIAHPLLKAGSFDFAAGLPQVSLLIRLSDLRVGRREAVYDPAFGY